MVFAYSKKGHWNIGMYTDKDGVHVGNIAKKYGGGGHAGAAGFQIKNYLLIYGDIMVMINYQ